MYDCWWNPPKKVMHCSGTFLKEWGGAMRLFSCPLFKRPAIKKHSEFIRGINLFATLGFYMRRGYSR